MSKRTWIVAAVAASFAAGIAYAQFPIMDKVADKVIQKYQTSTCEQLWQEKAQGQGQPKPEMEQRAIRCCKRIHRCARRSSPRSRRPSSTRCSNAE